MRRNGLSLDYLVYFRCIVLISCEHRGLLNNLIKRVE